MNIISWIIFGALSGWLASMVVGTNKNQGFLGDVLLGIVGAVVGGYVFNLLSEPGVTGFNVYSLVVAVVGSLLLLLIGRALRH